MSEENECDDCGRRLDRPAGWRCDKKEQHPKPTRAQRIVEAIEKDFSDRRGLRQEWDEIDDGIQNEIRDEWAELVQTELDNETPEPHP